MKKFLLLIILCALLASCNQNNPETPVEDVEIEYPLTREGVKLLFEEEMKQYHAVYLSKEKIAPNTVIKVGTYQLNENGNSYLVDEVISPSDSCWAMVFDHDVEFTSDGRRHWELRLIRETDGSFLSSMHFMLPYIIDDFEYIGKKKSNRVTIVKNI